MSKLNILITSLLSLCIISSSFAAEVDKKTAEKVARNFYYERVNQYQQTSYNQIVFTEFDVFESNSQPIYYTFELSNKGFVIVAADDVVYPVLGYSFENKFDNSEENPAFTDWMNGYVK